MEQWSAHQIHNLEVAGSNPASATNYNIMDYKQHKGKLRGKIKDKIERKLYKKRIRLNSTKDINSQLALEKG